MESKSRFREKIYNHYSFDELLIKSLLVCAYACGIITENGLIRKSRLRRLIQPKHGLHPRQLGLVLNIHGYLDKLPRKKQVNGVYKLNVKKLSMILDEYVKTTQSLEFNDPAKFIELKHQKTVKNGKQFPEKVFEIKSNMSDDFLNFELTVDAKIKVLHNSKLLLESNGAATLGRHFFKKPKLYTLILESNEIVEEYAMVIKGQLQEVIKERRRLKEGQHPSDKLPKLPSYPLQWNLLKYFTFSFDLQACQTMQDDVHQQLKQCHDGSKLSAMNYVNTLRLLVQVDDLFVNHIVSNYKIRVKVDHSFDVLCINISSFECFPDVIEEGDFIRLRRIDLDGKPAGSVHMFTIWKIADECVYFFIENNSKLDTKQLYLVTFQKDRTSAIMEYEALRTIKKEVITSLLFPDTFGLNSECSFSFVWFNQAIKTNIEQQHAVMNIVKGTACPAPYVIFGPPGTGKTSTVVETIAQIWKLKPTARILVTAPSNTACDEIALRLLRYLPAEDLYRYYSKSAMRQIKEIPDEILNISNLMTACTYYRPLINILKNYRIILTTVVNSGRLIQQKLSTDYFQYIFFDECGSCREPLSLIPIAGLVSNSSTNIVIAGDPKQLGPVVKCKFAESAGLGISLLERIMQMDLYQPQNGNYNEKVITKLLQNFRSHPAILKVPNELFYDGKLLVKAESNVINFALNWEFLPNKDFPIIFHRIEGHTKTDDRSPSMYNDEEMKQVFWYIREIVRNGINGTSVPLNEIGVVAPYRLQCQKISKKLRSCGWREIEVGSAEQFQGKEKMAIIISTVRSNTKTTGFLGNPKRLNVIITRAKGLMIIVGNNTTLQMDPNWLKLIEFYAENGAIKGTGFDFGKLASAESLNNLTLPDELKSF